MSTDPDTASTRTDSDCPVDFETDPRDDSPRVELRSVVVNYETEPDRRTVYPAGTSGVERMSTWLTADDEAFTSLEATR